jgi:Spy/CpxP family protein refolding chaperone
MNAKLIRKRAYLFVPVLLLFMSVPVMAQRPTEEGRQKIQDAKVAIITNRLNLSAEQSAGFWPIYNEYSQKRREIHRAQRKIINDKKAEGKTDEQFLSNLREVQDLRQKELDLDKDYQNRFLKVITANQVVELYKAEKTFNDMLLQRLNQRQSGNPN